MTSQPTTSCRRFVGKVALVTASTAGIGLATAERLLQEGATVIICSRSQANVDAALASLRSRGHAAAVSGVAANINTPTGVDTALAAVAAAVPDRARAGGPS